MTHDAAHSVLGIVPARGGSKGIARKNIRLLGGKPLLAYTAAAAHQSTVLSRVLLSTDDSDIAEIGKGCGLDVPFLRPAELAQDATPMIDVILHAIRWVERQGQCYDAVCLLQPTSPLRTAQTIDRSVTSLWQRNVDTVISVRPVPTEYNPHWVYFETAEGLLQPSIRGHEPVPSRQLLPLAYHRDGSVFAAKTEMILTCGSLYGAKVLGVVSPEEEAFDLDTEEQWQALEHKLSSAHEVAAREVPSRGTT
jgi:CMP-N,N'-diacetyllegionaminic acid synthase